jgi:HSP20 family protein
MMALARWDSFRELTALQAEVDRLLSRTDASPAAERLSWTPSVDVIETDDAIKVKAELAGMDPKDISIEVRDSVLTLSGDRRLDEEVKEDKYCRIERRYGSFSRSIALPHVAMEEKIEARYDNGVLEVIVPKAAIARPEKIAVAIGAAKAKTIDAAITQSQ